MKNKKNLIGLSVFALLAAVMTVTSVASAYQGDYTKQGPNTSPERHEAMQAALTNTDYQAWQELMNDRGRVKKVINEKNFLQFSEAWRLAKEGKYDEADAIRQELGLRGRDGQRLGVGYRGIKGDRIGQGQRKANGNRGFNMNGNFVDADGDGACDNLIQN